MLLQSGCATRMCCDAKPLAGRASGARNEASTRKPARPRGCDQLEDLGLNDALRIVNLDLNSRTSLGDNVDLYYNLCRNAEGLSVTTSCFTVWKQHQRANGYAKVIPAVRTGSSDGASAVRVFFFDDNVEFDGREESPGICNLRDVETGDFVPFGVGSNGFASEAVGRHTIVHHSSQYSNVIVKANILDAMEDENYFLSIVRKYALPDEKVIVFMDVNSTIMCNDTGADKDMSATLLSVMFELIEVRPFAPLDFAWGDSEPSCVEKPRSLKQVVKQLTSYDHKAYSSFWREETCFEFLDVLSRSAEIRWSSHAGPMTAQGFRQQFATYSAQLTDSLVESGITRSWFKFFAAIEEQERHSVVLNSFGVDTRKVVLATVPDETKVAQITVNYELWGTQDVQKFEAQYRQREAESVQAGHADEPSNAQPGIAPSDATKPPSEGSAASPSLKEAACCWPFPLAIRACSGKRRGS